MIRRISILALFFALPLSASDAYLLQFLGGNGLYWSSTVLLYNGNDAPAAIRLLGGSNGVGANGPAEFSVAPHRTTPLLTADAWRPPVAAIWMLHVDIPSGMVVRNRNDFEVGPPPGTDIIPTLLGNVNIPIFRSLSAANVPQVHIGEDLSGLASRINVVVYNAGDQTATAKIEMRRACFDAPSLDDALTDSRTITIPPNEVVQSVSLDPGFAACEPFRNVIITVDQPSLSFVTTLPATGAPTATINMSGGEQF